MVFLSFQAGASVDSVVHRHVFEDQCLWLRCDQLQVNSTAGAFRDSGRPQSTLHIRPQLDVVGRQDHTNSEAGPTTTTTRGTWITASKFQAANRSAS